MSKKDFNIEEAYDTALVEAGEQLWMDSLVCNLTKNENGIYLAHVQDNDNFEIEISNPFSKKQMVSCACASFKASQICPHIIAGLFAIRSEVRRKEEKKQTKQSSKPATLSTQQIASEIREHDLRAFVKTYAKSDKRFATQLKITFAQQFEIKDNVQKYKSILDSIVKPVTGTDQKLPASELRQLILALNEFADQINDNIALSHYKEALNIFIASFAKLEYVRSKFNLAQHSLDTLSKAYHDITGYFLERRLPVDIKRELHTFLTDFIQRSYYSFDSYQKNILFYLLPKLSIAEKAILKDNLLLLLKSHSTNEHAVILSYHLKLSKQYTKEAAAHFVEYPLQMMETVNLLLTDDGSKIALDILEKTYKILPNNKDIVNRLLYLYAQDDDKNALISLAQKSFFNWGDIKYLELLKKSLSDDQYTQAILKMEAAIHQNACKSQETALKFFHFENNWAGMVLYMEKNPKFDLLAKYDAFIYSHNPAAIADLYTHVLDTYLQTQLGEPAQQLLQGLYTHWLENEMADTIQKIRAFLSANYGHRSGLLASIS